MPCSVFALLCVVCVLADVNTKSITAIEQSLHSASPGSSGGSASRRTRVGGHLGASHLAPGFVPIQRAGEGLARAQVGSPGAARSGRGVRACRVQAVMEAA